MSKISLNYLALLALLGVIGYNSVYIKKLDEVKAASSLKAGEKFDAAAYASTFWATKLIPAITTESGAAAELSTLVPLLKTDPEKAFDQYSHALGIGNIRYFLVRGEGTVTAIRANDIQVSLASGESVHLATEFIFGNAARDASGLIKITEFANTVDLNNVSAEINTIIRNRVIPLLKGSANQGAQVQFIGAIELNRAHVHLDELEIIPLKIVANK